MLEAFEGHLGNAVLAALQRRGVNAHAFDPLGLPIQDLVSRHLALRPIETRQYDRLDNLPERPPDLVPVEEADPIGVVIAHPEILHGSVTGSLGPARR